MTDETYIDDRHERGVVPNVSCRERIAAIYESASVRLDDIAWIEHMRLAWPEWFAENYSKEQARAVDESSRDVLDDAMAGQVANQLTS